MLCIQNLIFKFIIIIFFHYLKNMNHFMLNFLTNLIIMLHRQNIFYLDLHKVILIKTILFFMILIKKNYIIFTKLQKVMLIIYIIIHHNH